MPNSNGYNFIDNILHVSQNIQYCQWIISITQPHKLDIKSLIYNHFYFLFLRTMAKKEENMESCSCGCKSWGKFVGISLTALWLIISIFTCLIACGALISAQRSYEISKASYDFNVLSAGWIENFTRMSNVYASEAYIEYATENTDQAEAYFGLNGDETTSDSTNTEEDTSIAGGDDVKTVVENLLATAPIRWDANARFTIIEYTELLCPYCQRHSQNGTIDSVIAQFPGEVNSVSRHFIIHGEEAVKLSAAMECVAELNPSIYHEAFHKAFEAYPVTLEGLLSIATELGTDATALQTCVDEGRYTQAVYDMMNQGSELFGVNGTPGNVIIDRETGNYKLISGAYPVENFVEAINSMKNA